MTADAHRKRRRRVAVLAITIPADQNRSCDLRPITLTAGAFRDAIGGGLLDEAHVDTLDGHSYCVYADADRRERRLPGNPRAHALAVHLEWIDLVDRFHLLGDLLITGADDQGNDADLPHAAVIAAHRTGLLPCACDHD